MGIKILDIVSLIIICSVVVAAITHAAGFATAITATGNVVTNESKVLVA